MIFAFAIPVLGIAGEVIPVAASKAQRQYAIQQIGIGALGVLSFGAFAQPFFNADVSDQAVFVAMGLLVVLPVLIFMGGLADTLVKGKTKILRTPSPCPHLNDRTIGRDNTLSSTRIRSSNRRHTGD